VPELVSAKIRWGGNKKCGVFWLTFTTGSIVSSQQYGVIVQMTNSMHAYGEIRQLCPLPKHFFCEFFRHGSRCFTCLTCKHVWMFRCCCYWTVYRV